MNQIYDRKKVHAEEMQEMTEDKTDAWKETVRMDAIRIPHHAHSWLSEGGSILGKA